MLYALYAWPIELHINLSYYRFGNTMIGWFMWLTFFVAMLAAIAFLFAPGILALSGYCNSNVKIICFAPLFSVASYGVLAIVYSYFNIQCSVASMVGAALALALLCFAAGKLLFGGRRSCCIGPCDSSPSKFRELCLYFLVGILAVGVFFIKNLDGPFSFFQAFDNGAHLATLRAFLESGSFSPFGTVYPLDSDVSPFIFSSSFYPSAWHVIVALISLSTHVPITEAVNAVNASLIAIVFPAGMYLLVDYLFGEYSKAVLLGAIVSLSVVSCPWDFVIFGPLYPNLLAFVLVPSGITAFMLAIDGLKDLSFAVTLGRIALFCFGCIAIALAQPNGIFTMAMFLAPFLVDRVYKATNKGEIGQFSRPAVAALGMMLFVLLVWTAFYISPALSGLVQFNWAATTSPVQAVMDVVTFGMAGAPVQPLLSIACIFGISALWKKPGARWVVAPYFLASISYFLCVSTEGFLKHYIAGFWYTDPHRVAALVGLFAIPLIVVGVTRLFESAYNLAMARVVLKAEGGRKCKIAVGIYAVLTALLWFPSFELRGIASIETGFGYLGDNIYIQNDDQAAKVLTHEEEQFARKALKLVPDDALVINSPNDGSAFLYALDNVNLLYRSFSLPSLDSELPESVAIRLRLDEMVDNPNVLEAVKRFGAEYVLLLDQGEDEGENRQRFWSYFPDQWAGIESVTGETPGFTEILTEGDMSLLKIVS